MNSRSSLRRKIITIIIAVTVISSATGLGLEILSNFRSLRTHLMENITLDARLVSDYAITTLLFEDRNGAVETLKKLENLPSVVYGVIKNEAGVVWAEYRRDSSSDIPEIPANVGGSFHENGLIFTVQPISLEGELLGTVTLIADTQTINKSILNHIRTVLLILILIIIVATLLAYWLSGIISRPILRLAEISREIDVTQNYEIHIEKEQDDEIGELYESFNLMIERIGARKREGDIAREELTRERENLEIKVEERTHELLLAKEKAEESDKLKTSFLANMSHEIRTPLNAIIGFSEMMGDKDIDDQTRGEYQKIIDASSRDLITLIDDILDLAGIESNQTKIVFSDFSIGELVNEVFPPFEQNVRNEYPKGEVKAELKSNITLCNKLIKSDRLRLKQVLINILNNALKFTSEGFVELGYYPDETNKNIIFYIKDTGIGIEKNKTERIFERFTKVADVKDKLYRGTGLGLSIALKLINLLGGDIKVESEPGKGSIFYIFIPLQEALDSVANDSLLSGDVTEYPDFSEKFILIADDVEWNFKYLEILLSLHLKVKTVWVKDGREAIDYVKGGGKTDLVLMDIQMPGMNGLDATKELKQLRPELKIFAQTAYALPEDLKACYEAGCDDILVKPITHGYLLHKVSEVLQQHA